MLYLLNVHVCHQLSFWVCVVNLLTKRSIQAAKVLYIHVNRADPVISPSIAYFATCRPEIPVVLEG